MNNQNIISNKSDLNWSTSFSYKAYSDSSERQKLQILVKFDYKINYNNNEHERV
jgi:hypothetical protein